MRDQIALMRARLSYTHQRWTRADACTRLSLTAAEELLAELDAVRAELDEWKTHLIAEDERLLLTESVVVMERQLQRVMAERDTSRADERAKVVEWLREHVEERCAAFAADAIERGEHVPEAQR